MSVSKMKRLTVFCPKACAESLVQRLMKLRCVEISESAADAELARHVCVLRDELDGKRLSRISQAVDILDAYVKRQKPLFAQQYAIDREAFVSNGHAERAMRVVDTAIALEEKKNSLNETIAQNRALIVSVTPYLEYDLPLSFGGTSSTECFLGVLPPLTDLDEAGRKLYEAGAVADIISKDKNGIYAVYFCHRSTSAAVNSVLSSYGFIRADFRGVSSTARAALTDANRQIKLLLAQLEEIRSKLTKLSDNIEALEILYDICATEEQSRDELQKAVATESTVMLEGWIPCKREAAVEAFLEKSECAYEIREPQGEEAPPVLLQNNGFASNFEWVLGMYSYPAYGRFDPTFIMSIFYFIIFGIMFADVGYGAILVLACFGAVAFLKPGESMKRFLKMFGYCGISSIIFGVLFGAYFGDLPLAIMRNMMGIAEADLPRLAIIEASDATLAVFLDPLQNPMGFLIFTLGLGAVHLVAGMIVNFVILCRDGRVWDAIFDVGFYFVLFAGIGLLFVNATVGMYVALAAAVLIVLTHGRANKNIIKRIGSGLLGLYDLVNYAADLLSYSRILALGLSAGIIGQVINILGTLGGPTVMGFIMMVLVFIVGHLLNLAINVLGTFVHTSRLQYIEFFGKFYEDGGVPFEPTLPSEKYSRDTKK